MLTNSTVEILNKLATESDSLYSEGGLLYKYSFGHRCAHSDVSKPLGSSTDNPAETIELFICSAVSTPFPKVILPRFNGHQCLTDEVSNAKIQAANKCAGPLVLHTSGLCCRALYKEGNSENGNSLNHWSFKRYWA